VSETSNEGSRSAWIMFAGTILAAVIGAIAILAATGAGGESPDPTTGSDDPNRTTTTTSMRSTTTTTIEIPRTQVSVFVNRDSGPGGAQVLVSGEGFASRERVVIRFHTDQVASVTTNEAGRFVNVAITIPTAYSYAAPKQFMIAATGDDSILSARTPFTITG
jgi:hypothetical protein